MTSSDYLPPGLPIPVPEPDQLSAPFWEGLKKGQLRLQRCSHCRTWQWGPEWICNACHSFDVGWQEVNPEGRIYSYERIWHPVHPALIMRGPYLVVLVELPHAGGVRMVGNLLGDPHQKVVIGAAVRGEFESHLNVQPSYALLQWRLT